MVYVVQMLFNDEFNQQIAKAGKVHSTDLGNFKDEDPYRVLAMCVVAHVKSQRNSLVEWRSVTKSLEIMFYVPCDPGALFRVKS